MAKKQNPNKTQPVEAPKMEQVVIFNGSSIGRGIHVDGGVIDLVGGKHSAPFGVDADSLKDFKESIEGMYPGLVVKTVAEFEKEQQKKEG